MKNIQNLLLSTALLASFGFVSVNTTHAAISTDLSNITLWLDAEDVDGDGTPEGLSETGLVGSEVATWADKSGQSNDVTGAARPDLTLTTLNGKPVLDFDTDALVAPDAD